MMGPVEREISIPQRVDVVSSPLSTGLSTSVQEHLVAAVMRLHRNICLATCRRACVCVEQCPTCRILVENCRLAHLQ